MKKRILLAFIILSISGFTYAQDFKAGVLLGVNAAQLNGDNMGGFNKTAAAGGLFVGYQLSKMWGVQMEMVYSRKGSRTIPGANGVINGPWSKIRLNYIEVPLFAHYRYKKRLQLQAGFSGGYMINSSVDYGGGFIRLDTAFKRHELAYLAGAELRLTKKYSVNARFSQSIFSISPDNPYTIFHLRPGYINMLLQFTLRIKFNE